MRFLCQAADSCDDLCQKKTTQQHPMTRRILIASDAIMVKVFESQVLPQIRIGSLVKPHSNAGACGPAALLHAPHICSLKLALVCQETS